MMNKEANVSFPFADPTAEAFTNVTGAHTLLRKNGDTSSRDMSTINTIVLHQTACRLGWAPSEYYDVAAHVAINSRGNVLYVNDLAFTIYHSHAFGPYSIAVVIDGHFAGVEGDRNTVRRDGGKTNQLTEEQITGAQHAILWIIGECVARGATIKKIAAHRQSSGQKLYDPGSAIWHSVGLWAQRELNLENLFYETHGSGCAIPRQWDIRSLFDWGGEIDKVGIAIVQAVSNKRLGLQIEVDGIVGKQTRAAIQALNNDFEFKGSKIISNETIETLVATPEFKMVTDWIAAQVKQREIPVALLQGSELIDLFGVYEG